MKHLHTKSANTVRPSAAWVFSRPDRILAFGFGSGLIYPAPGTWGTLAGWALWFLFLQGLSDAWVVFVLLLSFLVGCQVSQRCGDALGVPDHSGMNWDEIVSIWLVLWLLPAGFWSQLLGVVLFRVFDILKPPPIAAMDQRFRNGFGVMIDDVVAAAYTLLVAAIMLRIGVWPA